MSDGCRCFTLSPGERAGVRETGPTVCQRGHACAETALISQTLPPHLFEFLFQRRPVFAIR
jgi:hypothetical protein